MIQRTSRFVLIFLLQLMLACSVSRQASYIGNCNEGLSRTGVFSKAAELRTIMDELTRNGVPGSALAVYSDEGWWEYASGYAKVEDHTPMKTCNLQYLQSISKTYMAVAILKLHEENKIDLDAS